MNQEDLRQAQGEIINNGTAPWNRAIETGNKQALKEAAEEARALNDLQIQEAEDLKIGLSSNGTGWRTPIIVYQGDNVKP